MKVHGTSGQAAKVGIVISLLLAGCGTSNPVVRNEPGTTFGDILVSAPRVAGRERLVNDRLEQDRWLSEQLNRVSEADLGYEGLVDIKNLAYTSAQLKAQVDSAYRLYAAQQGAAISGVKSSAAAMEAAEQARLAAIRSVTGKLNKGELTWEQANSQFKDLGVTFSPVTPGAPASAPNIPSVGSTTPGLDASLPGRALLDSKSTAIVPPGGSEASRASVQASPIDRFRDLLAVREEIRTARIENALDDAHDIGGNTLYRLTFDVTTRPQWDTSAVAVVEATVFTEPDPPYEMATKFRRIYEQEATARVDAMLRQIQTRVEDECPVERRDSLNLVSVECAITELAAREQSVVDYEARGWLTHLKVTPSAKGRGWAMSVDAIQGLRQLLVEAEARRLANSPASCYLEMVTEARYRERIGLRSDETIPPGMERRFRERVNVTMLWDDIPKIGDLLGQARLKAQFERFGCPPYEDKESFVNSLSTSLFGGAGIRSYAVTPREAVQRLSELGGSRAANELLLGLSALTPGAGISGVLQQVRANDALYQAVRRQPLIVGFGDGRRAEPSPENAALKQESTIVGWLIGPQFQLAGNGSSANFRQHAKQQSVSATLSVPAWVPKLSVCIRTYWFTETGLQVGQDGKALPVEAESVGPDCWRGQKISVFLPRRDSELMAQSEDRLRPRMPLANDFQWLDLTEGQTARILITGSNLWRATEVFLGGQKADAISLTPDMRGVQAVFNRVESPVGKGMKRGRADIMLFTSEGKVLVGSAQIQRSADLAGVTATGFSRRLVAGERTGLDLSARLDAASLVEVHVKDPSNATLDAKVAADVSTDGRRVSFIPDPLQGIGAGRLLDVFLVVKKAQGATAQEIPVARNLVYFPSAQSAQVQASAVGTLKQLPLTFNVAFSQAVIDGFAGAGDSRLRLRSTADVDGAQFVLNDAVCDRTKLTCKFKVTAPPDVAKQIADKKAAWTISLAFVGDDMPALDKTEFPVTP